ncbi:MAG: ATP-binding cassette domain-containing protein [Candidatus Obscuribacterales bacterium]|nr:ATP-binding cassette domain-containing protein [Candidatus Obscuribacterales bacterium]
MQERSRQPAIKVVDIRKSFDDREILKGISFEVYPGEILGIIGPSGCGKSTILKILCGLLEADSGEVIKYTDEIGLVFQGSALLNSYTVGENLGLALRGQKLSKAEREEQIRKTLQLVGLRDFYNHFPSELSGGQQKRTSFARAVVSTPKIILYDEPTTGLDPVMSTIIEDYMIDLEQELHAASIVVTHQHSTWSRTADRIIMMHAGKIVWEGKPADAINSDNPFMHQFAHATKEGPMLNGI